jgi:hydantoinase/carbamoylase family amidase
VTIPAPPIGARVDYRRLVGNLTTLAKIGAASGGGIHRPSYSATYRAAIDWVTQAMQSAGLRTHEDAAGNLIGRIGPDGPAFLCGSHIDTFPRGGAYDGALGVLAGIECARALKAEEDRLLTAFEAIAFADEEGAYLSLLGSRAMTGELSSDAVARASGRDGDLLCDALRSYGLDPARLNEAARKHDDFAGYIELHIEQGPTLAAEKINIGIVDAIFGIQTYEFLLEGQARHAGTTPIGNRQDALRAAAEAIADAFSKISGEDLDKVRLTYGELRVLAGATNIVPGIVTVLQEVRAVVAREQRLSD